jgi:hypothetical protein
MNGALSHEPRKLRGALSARTAGPAGTDRTMAEREIGQVR